MRPGIYKTANGETVAVTRTASGFRVENRTTGTVTFVSGGVR